MRRPAGASVLAPRGALTRWVPSLSPVAERDSSWPICIPLSALGGRGGRGEVGDARAAMIVQAILFYIFAAVAVASGVLVVSARNPVHSVLFLILAFFN